MLIEYRYIKYIGPTIYTKDICPFGWYARVSKTFLTHNKEYKLLKPIKYNIEKVIHDFELELLIEDDLLLTLKSDENEYIRLAHDNYLGEWLCEYETIEFISNRDKNLEILILD